MEDLKLRIAQLNELLEPGYRGVTPAEESAPTLQSPVQQTQQGGPQGVEPHVLNARKQLRKKLQEAGLAEKLDRADDFDERFDIVVRFVNEHVIPASFERLNQQWTVPEDLAEDARELKESIHGLETATASPILSQALRPEQLKRLKTETEGFAELRSKIDSARTALKSIRFVPPEEDDWWLSVAGKGEERVNMAADAKGTVERVSRLRESEMVGVIAELRRAAKRQEMATKSLNNELQELEQQLRQGTTELAGMGMGWILIGSDMDIFVRRFPLLLGLLLSIAIIWVAYRRVSLARAVEVLSSEDVGEDSRRFLQIEYGTLPAFLSWPHLALTIVGLVWIGFAAVSAARSPLVSGGSAAASGFGGAIALVAALAYRLYVFKQVPDTDSLALQD